MELIGTRFGDFSVDEREVIHLPHGLIGMPALKRFVVMDFDAETPLKWLQSVDDPPMGFIISDPRLFRPDYHGKAGEKELAELGRPEAEDLIVFVLCTLRDGGKRATGNLLGPIFVNAATRRGVQIIDDASGYSTHELPYDEARTTDEAARGADDAAGRDINENCG